MKDRMLRLRGRAVIRPERHHLAASLSVTVPLPDGGQHVDFSLHEGLKVREIRGDAVESWSYCDTSASTFAPEARGIRIRRRSRAAEDGFLELSISYAGQIDLVSEWEVNRITADWVELGLYSPWFPVLHDDAGRVPVDYDLSVDISPGYRVIGSHETRETCRATGQWRLSSPSPAADIVLLAAPTLEAVHRADDDYQIRVFVTSADEVGAARELAEMGLWILEFFGSWFRDGAGRRVTVVVAPRAVGGGYVRGPFVVLSRDSLSELRKRELKTFRWLAHEFAHLWWSMARTDNWEDWLNESFAEYCALEAVECRYSAGVARELMDAKRETMEGLPPVKGLDRASAEAYQVLYNKGCALLDDLVDVIGPGCFTELLRNLIARDVGSNRGFLMELEKLTDRETALEFQRLLDT